MISWPFPSEWHTTADNASIIDYDTVLDLLAVFRVFAASALRISSK